MTKMVRLTENKLKNIIKESISKIINENKNNLEIWYRGYDSKYDSQFNHLLWMTDDIDYAKDYGDAIEEITIDSNKLNIASMSEIDEIIGYEFDYFDGPAEEDIELLNSEGFDGYCFYANSDNSYCMCLWNNSPIINRRVLSNKEY